MQMFNFRPICKRGFERLS